jgi:hypothetical protein
MATTNDQHYANLYKKTFDMLNAQSDSRFLDAVRLETIDNGEYKYINQLGSVTATAIDSRNQATTLASGTHYRRRVGLASYHVAIPLDKVDELKMVADPSGFYMKQGRYTYFRDIDDAIIAAFDGTAYTDKTGSTETSYDSDMTISGTGSDGFTFEKLLAAKKYLDQNEVPDNDRYVALSAEDVEDLLQETEITSGDYNTSLVLVNGEIRSFLGFKFIRSERLGTSGNNRKCFYWQKDMMALALGGGGVDVSIDKRPDLINLKQILLVWHRGAARLQETGVGLILTK